MDTNTVPAQIAGMLPWLERQARARLHNPTLAEDAVSATLLAALEQPPDFAEPRRLKGWLGGVLRHKQVDALREFGARGLIVADEEALLQADASASDLPMATDPLEALERQHFLADLQAALDRLPARQAEVFLRCEVVGESAQSVSSDMGLTVSHAWVLAHRARKQLRQLLAPWAPDGSTQ